VKNVKWHFKFFGEKFSEKCFKFFRGFSLKKRGEKLETFSELGEKFKTK